MFKNKLDEFRTVTWNKARLVVQGYNQEEGIDYEEKFAILTSDVTLWYPQGCNFDLIGYADTDYAGFLVDRKAP